MHYVVKAISPNGTVAWLACGDSGGGPSLTIREKAQVFPSVYEAGKALSKLPVALGLVFYFEQSDGESATNR
jgi:dihydrodipicolinate synthase/N-acetylneuraminate lyase